MQTIIPCYDASMLLAASKVPNSVLILNPNDGYANDPAYKAHAEGNYGYVDLLRFTKSRGVEKTYDEVKAECKKWLNLKKLKGIFLDDYRNIWADRVSKLRLHLGCRLMVNPGTTSKVVADVQSMQFEDTLSALRRIPTNPKCDAAIILEASDYKDAKKVAQDKFPNLKYLYIHEGADNWKMGDSCYTRLSKHYVETN